MADEQQQSSPPSPPQQQQQLRIVRHAEASRYELYVEDTLAGTIGYRAEAGQLILAHTVVDPAFAGQGLGSRFVAGALDDARARGERVVPECGFVAAYLERHPKYHNMVATD